MPPNVTRGAGFSLAAGYALGFLRRFCAALVVGTLGGVRSEQITVSGGGIMKSTFVAWISLVIALIILCAAQDISRVDASTPRQVQVRIAKLAAPREVADHASIFVLTEHGLALAEAGDNGFSCLIEREKPNTMEPECYDAEGSKTTLRVRIFEEEQRAKGVAEEQIEHIVKERYSAGTFGPPSKPGIVYMLSDYNYVWDPDAKRIIHFPAHLMFYAPYATEKTVGIGAGAPYLVHPGEPDTLMIVVPAKSHQDRHD